MKAPDKKYPLSVIGNLLASTPPEEVVYMPDKIYFDGVDTSTTPRLAINEEYIHKDALLEWAKERREVVAKEVVIQEGVRLGADAAFEELIDKLSSL